jgi:hypothetical protein
MSALGATSYRKLTDLIEAGVLVSLSRSRSQAALSPEEIMAICEPLNTESIEEEDIAIAIAHLQQNRLLILDENAISTTRRTIHLSDDLLEALHIRDFIEHFDITEPTLRLTDRGAEHVQLALRSKKGPIFLYAKLGDAWLNRSIEDVLESFHLPPLRYLPDEDEEIELDQNSDQFREALSKLDYLIKALETNNQFKASPTEEGLAALEALKRTKQYLLSGKVSIRKLELMAYGALGYLATHLIDQPITEVAAAAWTAIKGLFA